MEAVAGLFAEEEEVVGWLDDEDSDCLLVATSFSAGYISLVSGMAGGRAGEDVFSSTATGVGFTDSSEVFLEQSLKARAAIPTTIAAAIAI